MTLIMSPRPKLPTLAMLSKKAAVGVTAALGSWIAAYCYIADEIDKSSSIVNQSLFNINISDIQMNELSLPVQIASGVRGKMNQFKGHADINFDVVDKNNKKYVVEVLAFRRGLNWKTESLLMKTAEDVEIRFIDSKNEFK